MPATRQRSDHPAHADQFVLILSHDPVAAALLGGLVETLGYVIQFGRPPESGADSLRRVKPRLCLVDCAYPRVCSADFFGRATMRGVCVVIFGTSEALARVQAIATEHNIDTLLMPPTLDAVEDVLQRAGAG